MSSTQDDDNSRKHPRSDEGEVVNHLLRDQKEEQESSQKRMKVDDNTMSAATLPQTLLTSAEEEGPVVRNKHAISIKRSGKKKMLHLWIWIRESPKWWLLMIQNGWASQLMRILTAAQRYADENDLQLVVHGVVYAEQVSRRDVLGSEAFGKLINELMGFTSDVEQGRYPDFTSGDKLWVMCTEYLRFGEVPTEVKWMIDSIELIGVSGVKFRVVTLEEFGLDRDSCMEALKELFESLRALAENASHRNTGKQVKIAPQKKKERADVERDAREIEKHLREHKSLPKAIQQNIKFYRSNEDDVKKLITGYKKAQKQIGESKQLDTKKVKEAVSLIERDVYGDMQLLKSQTGGIDVAFYFRLSSSGEGDTTSEKVPINLQDGGGTFDVPLKQLAHNTAMLRQLYNQQWQNEEIRVAVFFDNKKSRDSLCNAEFGLFLHGVFHQQFSSAIVTQWNRISTHLPAHDLVEHICRTRGTSLLFSEEIGQTSREVAIAESNRRGQQREFVERFKKRMEKIRDRKDETEKQTSLQYLTIGRNNYTKEEKNEFIKRLKGYGLNEDFITELEETAKKTFGSLDEDSSH